MYKQIICINIVLMKTLELLGNKWPRFPGVVVSKQNEHLQLSQTSSDFYNNTYRLKLREIW